MKTTKAVVEKLRQILALAKNNSNINEAAVAVMRAKEIADKYSIGWELLELPPDEIINYYDENECCFWKPGLQPWEIILANVVAEHNGCRVFTIGSYPMINIVGARRDIEICETLISWLQNQILVLSLSKSSPELETYQFGAIHKINEKLKVNQKKIYNDLININIPQNKLLTALAKMDQRLNRVDEFLQGLSFRDGKTISIDGNAIPIFNQGYSDAEAIIVNNNLMRE